MQNEDPRDAQFKKFYPNVKVIVGVLAGDADYHYGFYFTLNSAKDLKEQCRLFQEGKLPYVTSEEERKERAKVPFENFGSTFNSYEEVQHVCRLLIERHGNETLGEDDAVKLIAGILEEVRAQKNS
ncbi:MAG: hypothetical protein Q8Q39_05585 [bacterium]|nr:hypothetical protein [bacterium]